MNFLLNVTWLSDSVYTHVTLYALSPCFSLNIIVTSCSNDGMGLSVETLLGSERRHVHESQS